MTASIVRAAAGPEESKAVRVIVLAFSTDPVVRWCMPDPGVYLEEFPRFARAFGAPAFEKGSADLLEGGEGAALWVPPDTHPDEETMGAVIARACSPSLQQEVGAVMEQMAGYHPDGPHWYLPLIGVDPSRQGRGLGSVLMRHALDRCDRDHLPAYLESTNPRNIPFYERQGFERIGRIQVGSSPPVVPMLRRAR